MIRRILILSFILCVVILIPAEGTGEIDQTIDKRLNSIDIDGFDIVDFKNSIINGSNSLDGRGIIDYILSIVFKEAYNTLKTFSVLLIPVLLMGIIKNLSLKENGVSQMASICSYLAVSGIVIYTFSELVMLSRETVDNLKIMSDCLIPVLYSLILSLGKITSYTVMHPTVIFLSQFIILVINRFVFPVIMLAFSLNITDNITGGERLKKISELINKIIKWALIFMISLFTAVLSAQNILTHSFDSVAMKGTKFIVANFIPVVGGVISDGAESIGSSLLMIKNATGIAGVAGLFVVSFLPVVKIFLISLMYHILSALCCIINEDRISKVLDSTGSTSSMLGAVVVSITFLFVISVAIILGG